MIDELENLVLRTPLIRDRQYDDLCATEIYMKPENLQIFGCYKIRGILSVIAYADPVALRKGIATASAGNMAQAVAYVARILNIPCTIFMPASAPDVKKEMVVKLGARVIEMSYEHVWGMVRGDVQPQDEGIFIHPALNESLRKGYAAIAHEIIADLQDIEAVVIPFGVGGLSIGVGMEMKKLKPTVSIYTCEPETAAPLNESLKCGHAVSINRKPSFVDAIGTPEVLPEVYKLLVPIIEDSIVVPLEEIEQAVRNLLLQQKLLCEGAAACAYAASLKLSKTGKHKKIACILSGGNISPGILRDVADL